MNGWNSQVHWVLTLLLVSTGNFGQAADGDELLRQAVASNRAARQSIRSLRAELCVEMDVPRVMNLATVEYVRSGDQVLSRQTYPDRPGSVTRQVRNGELRVIMQYPEVKGKSKANVNASRSTVANTRGNADAWYEMLLGHCDANGAIITYEELLAAGTNTYARRERQNGDQYIVVTTRLRDDRGQETEFTFWHDLRHNSLISRREVTLPDGVAQGVAKITEWAEPEVGIYVPSKCDYSVEKNGEVTSHRVATLTNILVNRTIPNAALALPPIPAGTILHDEISGTEGPINPDWSPAGKQSPLRTIVAPPRASPEDGSAGTQSSSEPTSPTVWLTVISAVIAVAGTAAVVFVRWRRVPKRD